jgi:hypothetical protein
VLDPAQSTCSIQHQSSCKVPWLPFPSLRPEVLILSVHGLAILSCPECSVQVRCPPSASRWGFPMTLSDHPMGPKVVASQEGCP